MCWVGVLLFQRGEPHFFDWAYPSISQSSPHVAAKYSKMFHRAVTCVAWHGVQAECVRTWFPVIARLGVLAHTTLHTFTQRSSFDNTNGSTLFFDTTPAYVVEVPQVPKRLSALLPKIRVVLIVRDPTDRYRSELQMEVCRRKGNLRELAVEFHKHGRVLCGFVCVLS